MNTLRSPAPGGSFFNSLGGNTTKNTKVMNTMTNAANSFKNTVMNAANTAKNTSTNILKKGPSTSQLILVVAVVFVIAFLGIFWRQILDGSSLLYEQIRQLFGAAKSPMPKPLDEIQEDVLEQPIPPQEEHIRKNHEKTMVEKILPGHQQVYNVSKNSYTYYDAEPLCKALGSELATYEQVKQAYAQGADWCNYGWVKGQMAVYPTQTNTWEQIQQGPDEQRGACGRPGLNGGFFDNPELKFGVNCYGIKPEQKGHDAMAIAAGEGSPLSPSGLEFERKISKYRGEANSIAIMPHSKNAWSA
jgi:hypothetical protein